jgi:hypothetical protein
MGFSKNSEHQTGKGGLLRLREWTARDNAGNRIGIPGLKRGMKAARITTRKNKSRGGKRRAMRKKSGNRTLRIPLQDSTKPRIKTCSFIRPALILDGDDIPRQQKLFGLRFHLACP